jgi:cytochrome P450 / NADPH-cytochrome P450 reductase
MIGPGTGIAPLRALLQERAYTIPRDRGLGPCALLFGCRHPEKDWLYHEEFEELHAAHRGLDLFVTGFSLAPPTPKTYVQALILRHGSTLFRWIADHGAHVLVSGSAKRMPADVVQAVTEILQTHGGATAVEAAAYVTAMERTKRLVIEAWS